MLLLSLVARIYYRVYPADLDQTDIFRANSKSEPQ